MEHKGHTRLHRTSVRRQSTDESLYNWGDMSSWNIREHRRRMSNGNYVLGTREPSAGDNVQDDKKTTVWNIPF